MPAFARTRQQQVPSGAYSVIWPSAERRGSMAPFRIHSIQKGRSFFPAQLYVSKPCNTYSSSRGPVMQQRLMEIFSTGVLESGGDGATAFESPSVCPGAIHSPAGHPPPPATTSPEAARNTAYTAEIVNCPAVSVHKHNSSQPAVRC